MLDTPGNTRERYRRHVIEEIKEHARGQIAEAGVSALSMNAIAKLVGISGPGLYRYFAGRDELITALIRDAYRSLADAMRASADDGADVGGLARTLRGWALQDPHRYFLIYGTPIAGYHAPADTTRIAAEIMAVLVDAVAALPAGSAPVTPLALHLDTHRRWAHDDTVSSTALHRCLSFHSRLHGIISLELAGHYTGMGFDPELLFEQEVEELTTGLR